MHSIDVRRVTFKWDTITNLAAQHDEIAKSETKNYILTKKGFVEIKKGWWNSLKKHFPWNSTTSSAVSKLLYAYERKLHDKKFIMGDIELLQDAKERLLKALDGILSVAKQDNYKEKKSWTDKQILERAQILRESIEKASTVIKRNNYKVGKTIIKSRILDHHFEKFV